MPDPVTIAELTALLRDVLDHGGSAFDRGTVYISRAYSDADYEIRKRIRSVLERAADDADERQWRRDAEKLAGETTEATFRTRALAERACRDANRRAWLLSGADRWTVTEFDRGLVTHYCLTQADGSTDQRATWADIGTVWTD